MKIELMNAARHIARNAVASAILCVPLMASAVVTDSVPATLAVTDSTTLIYDTFKGKSRVGGATVVIRRDDSSYEISGQAWTEGIAKLFSDWESDFVAAGKIESGRPVLKQYSLIQRMRNKIRKIFFRDGQTQFVKESGSRIIDNPPSSSDFITALFLTQDCRSHDEVHNGKDAFRIELTDIRNVESNGATETQCTFEVTDEDNDRTTATIRLGDFDGIVIPVHMDFTGALVATFKLTSS